jgi:hypothetical protein
VLTDEKFTFYQLVEAMFEACSKAKPSPAALTLYWRALAQFEMALVEAAIDRAMRELKWPARPAELRGFAFDAKSGATSNGGARVYRCNWHESGRDEHPPGARPDEPSPHPTMWWCDRCTYFVGLGLQKPDHRPTKATVRDVVRRIADAQDGQDP